MMNKLLSASFSRLRFDKIFWIGSAFMLAAGIYVSIKEQDDNVNDIFYLYTILIGFAMAAFCGLFIGTEYSDGTMRNKLMVGHSRSAVYMSNYLTSCAVGTVMCCWYLLPVFAIGVPRLGIDNLTSHLLLALVSLLTVCSLISIFTLVCMLCSNKAAACVACLIGIFAFIAVAAMIKSRLDEPPMYDAMIEINVDGLPTRIEQEKNLNYLSGTKREIFRFFYDFLPTGQAIQLAVESELNPVRIAIYSLATIAASLFGGVTAFRKKDIK